MQTRTSLPRLPWGFRTRGLGLGLEQPCPKWPCPSSCWSSTRIHHKDHFRGHCPVWSSLTLLTVVNILPPTRALPSTSPHSPRPGAGGVHGAGLTLRHGSGYAIWRSRWAAGGGSQLTDTAGESPPPPPLPPPPLRGAPPQLGHSILWP